MEGGEFCEFFNSVVAGRDVLDRACKASWFEWLGGSTLVFWKWHCFKTEARDGFPLYFLKSRSKNPRKFRKGSAPKDLKLLKLFNEKLMRLLYTRCLERGIVRWDIDFFGVSKGESDIRIVLTVLLMDLMIWFGHHLFSCLHRHLWQLRSKLTHTN